MVRIQFVKMSATCSLFDYTRFSICYSFYSTRLHYVSSRSIPFSNTRFFARFTNSSLVSILV
uniref:Uncharacterized protein n=1 Tax=Utricularia reniformis TaxID=192314 RepID=A0A1Y0B179_9LAMI|nr:hypothetical protein AEK19_MT0982 [Utricularia reniformis]ART31206.1 hypothetical protein AEK19_MT0982 [Utricularia reniformis]